MVKVMTIVGTRPELIKMSRVIAEFDSFTKHVFVHTGQNFDYELNQLFFEDLGIRKPDFFLDAVGNNTAHTISNIIKKADEVMEKEKPDAILLYGDTNSCLSVIAAKRRKIPVFHMEAGNRCFDQRVPEELNRKILDHLSDINFVLTEHARRYLIAEGIRQETIIKTGSHMSEVLKFYMPEIIQSDVIKGLSLESRKFFVVSIHREENVDLRENLIDIIETLNGIAEKFNYPVIVSTHPRTRKHLDELKIRKLNPKIQFLKPFGFFDYIKLQIESLCVLSDSGTITEEASLLNLRAITLRDVHERPEGMDNGTLIMSGLKKDKVIDAINVIIKQNKENPLSISKVNDYECNSSVSRQILRVVLSYIGYINRTVWYTN